MAEKHRTPEQSQELLERLDAALKRCLEGLEELKQAKRDLGVKPEADTVARHAIARVWRDFQALRKVRQDMGIETDVSTDDEQLWAITDKLFEERPLH
jgi:hypothetical protein